MGNTIQLSNRKSSLQNVALAFVFWLIGQFASAQEAPEGFPDVDIVLPPPLPVSDLPPEVEPPPDWLAWKALHASLDYLARDSVSPSVRLRGLSPQEADAVLQAGYDYQRRLESIDDEARQEILARFRPHNAPALPAGFESREVIQLPNGRTLREILEPEGFYERIEKQKESLLDSHRNYLDQLIGPAKLQWLDNYVESVIAPSVKVVTRGRRLPPGETPATLRNRAP